MAAERNLIIVHARGFQALSDFTAIRALIAERAPDIETFIVTNRHRNSVTRKQASHRPTLVFSPEPIDAFMPTRGKVLQGSVHSKFEEVERLIAGGVSVPEAVLLQPNTHLDPRTWGPYTVLKPNAGKRGRGVRLCRTTDVRWVDPTSWPPDDPRHGKLLVAQRFIDTGPFPESHRVFTVLGRPVYSIVSRSNEPRRFNLNPRAALDVPIASNSGDRTLELNDDTDVLELAGVAARAFPEEPTLGIDIIREATTGDLYVLEANAGGRSWHLSTQHGFDHQVKYGLDLYGQFGALDTIADALIDVTRREAV